ncbi:MAG: ABC transporter substrate-binding protein [Pseudomonadota bacterium]
MKKYAISAVIASVFTLSAPYAAQAYPVTVKSCDREVTFDQAPKRAVSHDINITEMMLALELQDHMVGYTGISGWNKITPGLQGRLGDIPQLAEKYPSKEVLLGADADFYFAGWNYGMKVGGDVTPETLAPFGINVYELGESCIHIMTKPHVSMEDMFADLLNLGTIFDVRDRAEKLVEGYRAELADITAHTAKTGQNLRVFVYDSDEERPFTAARYAMPTAMIEAAGGKNIVDDVESSWTRVGWETVIERNPEIIVIVNYGTITADQKIAYLKSNPAFANIDAVRHDRFVVLEYDEATPGPRNLSAIGKLARAFYPSAF